MSEDIEKQWKLFDDAVEKKIENQEEKRELQEQEDDEDIEIKEQSHKSPDLDADRDLVGTQMHELRAHLLFAHGDLDAYHAITSEFDIYLDAWQRSSDSDDMEEIWLQDAAGDDWRINASNKPYWQGQIAAEGEEYEKYNEYQISLYADDDMAEEKTRKATLQFRPALPDATKPDGSRIQSMPEDLPYGVRVQCNSSNVSDDEIIEIIQAVAQKLDLSQGYFTEDKIHDWSQIYSWARYVRINRDISEEQIVGAGKILDKLTAFGRSRKGSVGEFKWNNEEIMGHYTAVAMCKDSWSKLIPGRMAGYRLKSYHMKNPEASAGTTTSHPKLEVQLTTDSKLKSESIAWHKRNQLNKQLEEILLNALQWSGISIDPSNDDFESDAYFDPLDSEREHDVQLLADPIETIQEQEGDLAMLQLAQADLSNSEEQVVETLTDGGAMHYETLADQADVSESTVYRALDKIDTIVEKINGEISLADDYIRDKIEGLFSAIETAADRADSKISELISGDLDVPESSPFAKWVKTYVGSMRDLMPYESPGVGSMQHSEGWQEIVLNVSGTKGEITRILRAGGLAALETDRDILQDLRKTVVKYHDPQGNEQEIIAGAKHGASIKVGGFTLW